MKKTIVIAKTATVTIVTILKKDEATFYAALVLLCIGLIYCTFG